MYAYLLRVRHSSGFTDEAKVQQKLLELVGGDRSRMASCFIVDQLVFMELMAQQRR